MASSDSQIDKPQRGRPKRAELLGVNINTGAQSINTEKASLNVFGVKIMLHLYVCLLNRLHAVYRVSVFSISAVYHSCLCICLPTCLPACLFVYLSNVCLLVCLS